MRMKKIVKISILLLGLIVAFPSLGETRKKDDKKKVISCKTCHTDLKQVLPQNHREIPSPRTITGCIPCHKPDTSGKPEKRPFSAKIHRPHVKETSKVDCTLCHIWHRGKFGILGTNINLGVLKKEDLNELKKAFNSWAISKNLDAIHNKADIVCLSCHGNKLPSIGDTVENDRCLSCHGNVDSLAERSAPKEFPDRNPHKSHLGDIACAVCHHGHRESKAYCLNCHVKFEMKIPGGN